MEFVQFHPTTLFIKDAPHFLISEAVRGEGGILLNSCGDMFMGKYHDMKELAPRDIVSRAILNEMQLTDSPCVYLDATHLTTEYIQKRFPTIYQTCIHYGVDISSTPIPVRSAAHFMMGGIQTNTEAETNIKGLFACGEAACTGVHGANRLASNSLLECLVFATAASEQIQHDLVEKEFDGRRVPAWDESQVTDPDEQIVVTHNWDELRRAMWDYVGIVRTDKRLQRAMHRVKLLQEEIRDYYSNFKINNNLIELRNLVAVAELIIGSALSRRESRGLHYTLDYPDTESDDNAADTIMVPTNFSNDRIGVDASLVGTGAQ